ncbi:RNA-directed DNA polymerase, eukaryota [Tanacetum coccineum]
MLCHVLLTDDKEWAHAIKEAAFWALAPQLRDLFITMFLFWDLKEEQIKNYCLVEIEALLNRNGRSLTSPTGTLPTVIFFTIDEAGNAIHSFTKANVAHNFLKLKEGSVYYITDFVIQANKEEYRIFKDHAYMIELDGVASILDDPQIPALKASRAENSEDEVSLSQAAKCKKGVVWKEGSFWCQACDMAVEYPVLRFRIELDVSDKTASTMVVMFDEPATNLVKCSADSLAAADEDVGLAYADDVGCSDPWQTTMHHPNTEEVVEEDARSSNCMDDGQEDGKDSSVLDKRKKNRYIVDDSTSE